MHELIQRAKACSRSGRRLLAGTSYAGMRSPDDAVAAVSDLLTMHGNGARDPGDIEQLVARARALPSYRPMPVLFNEDYHYAFDQPRNNFTTAIACYAGWGYYDPGNAVDERGLADTLAFGDYVHGFQSPPVNWTINTPRKQAFFNLLREVTGAAEPAGRSNRSD